MSPPPVTWDHVPQPTGRLARRATTVLANAGRRLARGGVVLVPALYCAEVADAISAAGCRLRCYDVPEDLSAPTAALGRALDDDVTAVLWHHPFGWYHRPPGLGAGITLIEDACFSLRAVLTAGCGDRPDLLVTSLRKELSWPDGAFTLGRYADLATAGLPTSAALATRWRRLELRGLLAEGVRRSRWARHELSDWLPPADFGEPVATMLPLLSDRRDAAVDTLRSAGLEAWYWQRTMHGCTPEATPRAWALGQRLFLVRTPAVGSSAYSLLCRLPLISFGG